VIEPVDGIGRRPVEVAAGAPAQQGVAKKARLWSSSTKLRQPWVSRCGAHSRAVSEGLPDHRAAGAGSRVPRRGGQTDGAAVGGVHQASCRRGGVGMVSRQASSSMPSFADQERWSCCSKRIDSRPWRLRHRRVGMVKVRCRVKELGGRAGADHRLQRQGQAGRRWSGATAWENNRNCYADNDKELRSGFFL